MKMRIQHTSYFLLLLFSSCSPERRNVSRQESTETVEITFASLTNRIAALQHEARHSEAIEFALKVVADWQVELGLNHSDLVPYFELLGDLYTAGGQYEEAEQWYQQELAIIEKSNRADVSGLASCLDRLGKLYTAMGRFAEAEPPYQRALRIREKLYGGAHPDVATSLNNLAELHSVQWKLKEAEALCLRALTIRKQLYGDVHPDVAVSMNYLAVIYRFQGKYRKAESLQRRAVELGEKTFGLDHPEVLGFLSNLAELCTTLDLYEEAEMLHRRVLDGRKRMLRPDHPHVAHTLNMLGELCGMLSRYQEAETYYQRALAIQRRVLEPNSLHIAKTLRNLAENYHIQGLYDKAEPLYRAALDTLRSLPGLGSSNPRNDAFLQDGVLICIANDSCKPTLREGHLGGSREFSEERVAQVVDDKSDQPCTSTAQCRCCAVANIAQLGCRLTDQRFGLFLGKRRVLQHERDRRLRHARAGGHILDRRSLVHLPQSIPFMASKCRIRAAASSGFCSRRAASASRKTSE